jgi:hypothetical protein
MATKPLSDLTATWNAAGTTFTAVKMNVTDTASAAGSLLIDLQVGGVSKFSASKSGVMLANGSLVHSSATAPVFRAVLSGNQTGITDATHTKIAFDTESIDVGGYFDTINNRWTPPAVPVVLYAQAYITGTMIAGSLSGVSIYKNGAAAARPPTFYAQITNECRSGATYMDVANGTDYYEAFAIADVSAGTVTVQTGAVQTFFYGFAL